MTRDLYEIKLFLLLFKRFYTRFTNGMSRVRAIATCTSNGHVCFICDVHPFPHATIKHLLHFWDRKNEIKLFLLLFKRFYTRFTDKIGVRCLGPVRDTIGEAELHDHVSKCAAL